MKLHAACQPFSYGSLELPRFVGHGFLTFQAACEAGPTNRRGWEWKLNWYAENGYRLGENLFTTENDERGGLDSATVRQVAERVTELI